MNIFWARRLGSRVRDIERTAENLDLVLHAALHGIDRSKFKQDLAGKIVNRAELPKLTSRKPKATLRQILAVLEQNLEQEVPIFVFRFQWHPNRLSDAFAEDCCTCNASLGTSYCNGPIRGQLHTSGIHAPIRDTRQGEAQQVSAITGTRSSVWITGGQ